MHRVSLPVRELVKVLILAGIPYMFWIGQGFALPLSSRSITISTATPSAVATHSFQMTVASSDPIGSIEFQYCSNSPLLSDSCNAPAGLSLSGAVLSQQTGNTGFSVDGSDSSASTLIISRPPVAAATVPSSYVLTNVINPSAANQTTYVRITTYGSSDAAGSYIDNGSVAFSTQTNFAVGAYVPPFLNFCTGVTVASDCSQAQGDSLDLGTLSAQTPNDATSQFAASTNDVTGCDVYVLGTTMTSGNNVIPPVIFGPADHPGVDQFGINLRRNTAPAVGADPDGAGTVAPDAGYSSPNLFSFVPGSQIANSPESTDYSRVTVSYVVNVGSGQPPGVYSTTLTYLASAQF